MDCLEFRRLIAATPNADHAQMRAHRNDCTACATAWERAQRFEHELEQALHIPVPEGLADRVVLAQATGPRSRFTSARRTFLALAASVLIALGAGAGIWQQVDAHSLPALAVTHMQPEISSLSLTRPISEQAVAAGFAARSLTLRGPVPKGTTYVHDCILGKDIKAVHLVTRRDGEAVAVLFVPHRSISKPRDFHRDGWTGREVPLDGGALVMLTDHGNSKPFNALARDWSHAIMGPTTVGLTLREHAARAP
jgi:hypothetical protein